MAFALAALIASLLLASPSALQQLDTVAGGGNLTRATVGNFASTSLADIGVPRALVVVGDVLYITDNNPAAWAVRAGKNTTPVAPACMNAIDGRQYTATAWDPPSGTLLVALSAAYLQLASLDPVLGTCTEVSDVADSYDSLAHLTSPLTDDAYFQPTPGADAAPQRVMAPCDKSTPPYVASFTGNSPLPVFPAGFGGALCPVTIDRTARGIVAASMRSNAVFLLDIDYRYYTPGGGFGSFLAFSVSARLAGTGLCGYSGDGGPAVNASLCGPRGVAVSPTDNSTYISDFYNNVVRRVDASGDISTFAGTARACTNATGAGACAVDGRDGQPATATALWGPSGLAVDGSSGSVFVAEMLAGAVRKVDAQTGTLVTVWPPCAQRAPAVDGTPPACPSTPDALALNASSGGGGGGGSAILYVADTAQSLVVAVDLLTLAYRIVARSAASTTAALVQALPSPLSTTLLPTGYPHDARYAGDGGPGTSASLTFPTGVTVDSAGAVVYIADAGSHVIRRISADGSGVVTTFAGASGIAGYSGDSSPASASLFYHPVQVAWSDRFGLLVADMFNNRVRAVGGAGAQARVVTLAGNGFVPYTSNGDGGPATAASLLYPRAVAVDASGSILIADNGYIRRVDAGNGTITTIVPTSGYVRSLAVDPASGTLYFGCNLAALNYATMVLAVVGGGARAPTPTPPPWSPIAFSQGSGLAVPVAWVAGGAYHPSASINPGVNGVWLLDTECSPAITGDGGAATASPLCAGLGLAVDAGGSLFIADAGNAAVRRVNLTTGVIYSVSVAPTDPSLAGFVWPWDVAVAPGSGDLYVADPGLFRVFRIAAGDWVPTYCPPGRGAAAGPGAMTCDVCAAGTYSTGGAPPRPCLPCPFGSVSPAFATNVSACVNCSSGKYPTSDGSSCAVCTLGAACLGAGLCEVGYAGALCASCTPGFYRASQGDAAGSTSCAPCDQWEVPVTILAVAGSVALVLLAACATLYLRVRDRLPAATSELQGPYWFAVGLLGQQLTLLALVSELVNVKTGAAAAQQSVSAPSSTASPFQSLLNIVSLALLRMNLSGFACVLPGWSVFAQWAIRFFTPLVVCALAHPDSLLFWPCWGLAIQASVGALLVDNAAGRLVVWQNPDVPWLSPPFVVAVALSLFLLAAAPLVYAATFVRATRKPREFQYLGQLCKPHLELADNIASYLSAATLVVIRYLPLIGLYYLVVIVFFASATKLWLFWRDSQHCRTAGWGCGPMCVAAFSLAVSMATCIAGLTVYQSPFFSGVNIALTASNALFFVLALGLNALRVLAMISVLFGVRGHSRGGCRGCKRTPFGGSRGAESRGQLASSVDGSSADEGGGDAVAMLNPVHKALQVGGVRGPVPP